MAEAALLELAANAEALRCEARSRGVGGADEGGLGGLHLDGSDKELARCVAQIGEVRRADGLVVVLDDSRGAAEVNDGGAAERPLGVGGRLPALLGEGELNLAVNVAAAELKGGLADSRVRVEGPDAGDGRHIVNIREARCGIVSDQNPHAASVGQRVVVGDGGVGEVEHLLLRLLSARSSRLRRSESVVKGNGLPGDGEQRDAGDGERGVQLVRVVIDLAAVEG